MDHSNALLTFLLSALLSIGSSCGPAEVSATSAHGAEVPAIVEVQPRGFEGIERADNVCVAAIERAEAILDRSRDHAPSRKAIGPEELLVLQRESREEGDLETFAGCLAVDRDIEHTWAVGQLLAICMTGNIRETADVFARRFPGAGDAGSPAAAVVEYLSGVLQEMEATPPDTRIRRMDGVLRILDAEGGLGWAIVDRAGIWYVTDPIQREDVVHDGVTALLRGVAETTLLRAAVAEARDLEHLESMLQPIGARAEADLAEVQERAAVAYAERERIR